MAQAVEHWTSKCEALSLNSSTAKELPKIIGYVFSGDHISGHKVWLLFESPGELENADSCISLSEIPIWMELTNCEIFKNASKRVHTLFLCGSSLNGYDGNRPIVQESEVVFFKFLQHHATSPYAKL
jgi:hypothetical protein